MSTQTYAVDGMTCGHCVGSGTAAVQKIDGVTDVSVDLVTGGRSTLTVSSEAPLARTGVAAAVDDAGYELVEA